MNLETDDPEKGQLLLRSERHRELLDEEMKAITEKSEKILTNALIIGGALALTYFLVTNFSGSGKQRTKTKKAKPASDREGTEAQPDDAEADGPGVVAQIGNVLIAQATGLLLSVAREKLVEFLQSQVAKKESDHERA